MTIAHPLREPPVGPADCKSAVAGRSPGRGAVRLRDGAGRGCRARPSPHGDEMPARCTRRCVAGVTSTPRRLPARGHGTCHRRRGLPGRRGPGPLGGTCAPARRPAVAVHRRHAGWAKTALRALAHRIDGSDGQRYKHAWHELDPHGARSAGDGQCAAAIGCRAPDDPARHWMPSRLYRSTVDGGGS